MQTLILNILAGLLLLTGTACAQPKNGLATPQEAGRPLAFPGAEGFGKYATGGRGGAVYIVTNLEDAGPGSFREAVTTKGPRMVVFEVSGTIHLNSPLSIKGDITIAGQTAPGDGICLADQPVTLGGDNIIVRYLRFRMGDRFQQGGMVDGNGGDDAFGGTRKKQIIIDHCSLSWSTDEVLSVYAGDSTTLQWNLITEPLNYSYHFESGDKDWEHHGYGGIWGGLHLSAHHNLFAHCTNRNPRFNGIRHTPTELVDYRNNVLYNWGINTIYAGEGGAYNIVNNYYRYGPSTSRSARFRIANPGRNETIGFGKWYVAGNYVDGAPEISRNNWLGVEMGNNGTEADKKSTVIESEHNVLPIPLQTAQDAYEAVLNGVGASYRRDTLDQRIIAEVKTRTGTIIDVQGHYPHGTAYEQTRNAWPLLAALAPPVDADRDGIPDAWELAHQLDPKDPLDARKTVKQSFYSNLEWYINSIVQ